MISSEKMIGFSRGRVTSTLRPVAPSERIFSDDGEEVFIAGQVVPAGTYRQLDSPRFVTLEVAGPLSPSFDGRRAEYCRVERPWITAQIVSQKVIY